jgi:hypothetical protein
VPGTSWADAATATLPVMRDASPDDGVVHHGEILPRDTGAPGDPPSRHPSDFRSIQDTQPETQDTQPETQGTEPETQDTEPETQGTEPEKDA